LSERFAAVGQTSQCTIYRPRKVNSRLAETSTGSDSIHYHANESQNIEISATYEISARNIVNVRSGSIMPIEKLSQNTQTFVHSDQMNCADKSIYRTDFCPAPKYDHTCEISIIFSIIYALRCPHATFATMNDKRPRSKLSRVGTWISPDEIMSLQKSQYFLAKNK
jgi:hypothetical protein